MNTMKRALIFSAILLLSASAAFAQRNSPTRFSNRLFNDVVEMTRAGLSDDTIVAYVRARRARLDADVSAGDLIRLRRSGVHETVVAYIAGVSGIEGAGEASNETRYDSSGERAQPVEPSQGEDEAYAYAYGHPYWYGWLGYPYWYGYDPFFSTTFFVGGRSFHGGGFGHRGFGHGGGHGGSGGHHGGGHGRR